MAEVISGANCDGGQLRREQLEQFRKAVIDLGDLVSAIEVVDPSAADAYRINLAEQASRLGSRDAVDYGPNIAATYLREMLGPGAA